MSMSSIKSFFIANANGIANAQCVQTLRNTLVINNKCFFYHLNFVLPRPAAKRQIDQFKTM